MLVTVVGLQHFRWETRRHFRTDFELWNIRHKLLKDIIIYTTFHKHTSTNLYQVYLHMTLLALKHRRAVVKCEVIVVYPFWELVVDSAGKIMMIRNNSCRCFGVCDEAHIEGRCRWLNLRYRKAAVVCSCPDVVIAPSSLRNHLHSSKPWDIVLVGFVNIHHGLTGSTMGFSFTLCGKYSCVCRCNSIIVILKLGDPTVIQIAFRAICKLTRCLKP